MPEATKIDLMKIGCFILVLLAWFGLPQLTAGAAIPRAEAFRIELAERDMIVGDDTNLGTARAIAYSAKHFPTVRELKSCGLAEVFDTPNHATAGSLNTFAVSFRGRDPDLCSEFKDGHSCEALRSNCITLETSVFCDYDYLYLLRASARSSMAYLHLSLAPDLFQGGSRRLPLDDIAFLPFSPDLLVDLAKYQAAPKKPIGATVTATDLPLSLRSATNYANEYGSVLLGTAERAAIESVIAHEISHVENNACGGGFAESDDSSVRWANDIGIKIFLEEDIGKIVSEYTRFTCHALTEREIRADIRAIATVGRIVAIQHTLWWVDIADKGKGLEDLWKLGSGVAVVALAQALEYQLLMSDSSEAAIARVRAEPATLNILETHEYYRRLGYEVTRKEMGLKGSRFNRAQHMHPSYRAGLLLNTMGLEKLYENQREYGFAIVFPIRLYGYIQGSLEAIQVEACSMSRESAEKNAVRFLSKISGATGGFLVDSRY